MIKAFNDTKLIKAIKETESYCKKFKTSKSSTVNKQRAYLKLLKQIKSHADSKKSTNYLILKDKYAVCNYHNVERLGIKVDTIEVESRNWVGGYVNKFCFGTTIKGVIFKLKKPAPSYPPTN